MTTVPEAPTTLERNYDAKQTLIISFGSNPLQRLVLLLIGIDAQDEPVEPILFTLICMLFWDSVPLRILFEPCFRLTGLGDSSEVFPRSLENCSLSKTTLDFFLSPPLSPPRSPLAAGRSQPSLQLMYFGAAAMTQGLPATHSLHPFPSCVPCQLVHPACLSSLVCWRSSATAT